MKDTIDHVFGFFRTIEKFPHDASVDYYLDIDPHGQPNAEARAQLDRLQADLRTLLPSYVLTYSAEWTGSGPSSNHLQQLCADVYKRLLKVIDEELQRRDRSDPVDQESIAHQTFGQERARVFIGRNEQLQAIRHYLDVENCHPLVVHGISGSGKSALLAKATQDLANRELICRYIGATPASSDILSLLEGLCNEITLRYGGKGSTMQMEYTELVVEFPNRLALATAEKPLVVFLDALDQLPHSDHGEDLAWLPAQLPEHARLVVSTLEGRSQESKVGRTADDYLVILRARLPAEQFLEVTPMSVQEGAAVLAAWLHEANRTLQPQQRDVVLSKFCGCPYPLYLKLAFEEARRWKSWETVEAVSDRRVPEEQGDAHRVPVQPLSPDIPGILNEMFARLEAERNHGRILVTHALGYLIASGHGLTEDELLDFLSADKEVMADFRKRSPISPTLNQLPVVLWARLFAELETYMTQRQVDGTTVLSFYHRQIGQAATIRYLPDQERRCFHDALATYFWDQADPDGNLSWRGKGARPILYLEYHLEHASRLQ